MGMTCARIGWSVEARPLPIMRNSRTRRLTAFQPLRRCMDRCDIPRSPSITTQPRYFAEVLEAIGGEWGSNGRGASGIGNRKRELRALKSVQGPRRVTPLRASSGLSLGGCLTDAAERYGTAAIRGGGFQTLRA